MDELKLLDSKRHIYLYNELTLLKKKLHKMHYNDSVYDSKIRKENVAEFSKTIIDVHGPRKRTVSNVNEALPHHNFVDNLAKQKSRAQNRGDKRYYPDGAKNIDENFGLNSNDDPDASLVENDKHRFTESLNANRDQCLVKYNPDIKSAVKYKIEQGLWQPKGKLVTTIYDHSNMVNKVVGLDVSQDSKYFLTTSNSKSINVVYIS